MEIINVSPKALKVHPRNQEFFDDIAGEEYERLKASIDEEGILSPLIVAPDMTIISGHQRHRAALDLGLETVPIQVREEATEEKEKTKLLLVANFGRMKNDPIKQARVFKEYENLRGINGRGGDRKSKCENRPLITQGEIARELGVSERQLKDIKRLLNLDPDLQEMISSGKVTASTGYKILARLSPEEQAEVFSQLPKNIKLSQKEVQDYVSRVVKEKDEDISDMVDRIESLKGDLRRESAKAKEAQLAADAFERKLKQKDIDIAGEFIVQRDKAVQNARTAQEKYIKAADDLRKTEDKLTLARKKLEELEANMAENKINQKEVAEMKMHISLLEGEKAILQRKSEIKVSCDVDDLIRFMDNACKILNVYSGEGTKTQIENSPIEIRRKIAEMGKYLAKSASELAQTC